MNELVTAGRRTAGERLEAARSVAARADRLHGGQPGSRMVETLPALRGLFPGGGLRVGSVYSVEGSTALAMALMAGPSGAGAWCGVLGLPGFGAEAAAGLGVDLDRLVLVPEPGTAWRSVLATLIDALPVIVVETPRAVTDAEGSRLGARLRQRGGVLITCGPWPQCEARLSVSDTSWVGLGTGHGHLTGRQVTVLAQGRDTAIHPRRSRLWLPGPAGDLRSVEDTTAVGPCETGIESVWVHEAAG